MDYGSVVKGAWDADPTFVELCKALWGPAVTAEDVVGFAKDGPDPSSVHVPGNASSCGCKGRCKHKSLPVMDDRGIAKASSYDQIPQARREFKRDDNGRFASVGEIATNATIAGTTGLASGLGLNHARGDAGKLARMIGELRSTSEGRARLLRAIAARKTLTSAGRLGLLAGGSVVVGAVAGHHGKEAYEGIRDHAELEAEHARHVAAMVRHDNTRSFVSNTDPHDLHVRTRGARRDAVTNVYTQDRVGATRPGTDHLHADVIGSRNTVGGDGERFSRDEADYSRNVSHSFRDTGSYRRGIAEANRRDHQRERSSSFGKAAEELTGQLTQIDTDKRQVFGWASIVEKNGEPVVDLQGDYIGIEELEKSAYDYVHTSRIGGAMHRRVDADGNVISKTDAPYHAADLIESFVVTPEKISKMGLPDDTPVGWWVGFKVNDDEVWKSVKSGDWKGFSIHGRGRRKPVGEVDSFDITGAELTR